VQASDFYDDFATNHVISNLKTLGEEGKEGMLILTQLSFGEYLSLPAYAAAVKKLHQSGLPLPSDLDTLTIKFSSGEADLILFHRYYGILIGELKSIGRWHSLNNRQPLNSEVAKKVTKAVTQLNKSVYVVRHVISYIAPGLTVKVTLLLPYVTRAQLTSVLAADPVLLQGGWRTGEVWLL
jgi:hypothetical protein